MFGLGWTEILVIAAVAVIVVPPKDLPGLMRNVGRTVGKMRRMAGQFQRELESAVRDDELDKLRAQMSEIGRDTDRQLRAASGSVGLPSKETVADANARYQRARQRAANIENAGPAMTPLASADVETQAAGEGASETPATSAAAAKS